jgi:hypothetical protein
VTASVYTDCSISPLMYTLHCYNCAHCYEHSFEAFVDAVRDIKAGKARPEDYDGALATIGTTFLTTAILEAGRRSLDDSSRPYDILYEGADKELPSGLKAAVF